jgi:hypothetical protein
MARIVLSNGPNQVTGFLANPLSTPFRNAPQSGGQAVADSGWDNGQVV